MKPTLNQIEVLIDSGEMSNEQLELIFKEEEYKSEDVLSYFIKKLKDSEDNLDDDNDDYDDEEDEGLEDAEKRFG